MIKKDIFDIENEPYRLLVQLEDTMTIRQTLKDGYLELTSFSILPGICLVLNDIHTSAVPVAAIPDTMPFWSLNYCIDGRCEFRLNDDNYSYVDNGLTSIGAQTAHDFFFYPSAYYIGYEIYAFPSLLTTEGAALLESFSIQPQELFQQYQKNVCCTTPEPLALLWKSLYASRTACDIGYVRLITLEVLHYLCTHDPLTPKEHFFLTKTQSMLAKQANQILTADLSRHIAMRSIAEELGVSETSLKSYFRSVYGCGVSQYMNRARMQYAAELLITTKRSVADIARSCGYVNQGRFASLFRDCYGMKPLDYRRSARMQGN